MAVTARGFLVAWLAIVLAYLATAPPATAQSRSTKPRDAREPITPIPAVPEQDPRRVMIGEQLFHDPRLSHDGTRSCASCHDLNTNGASANARDTTPRGDQLALNTPSVFNVALNFRLNWEGNFRSLEQEAEQALGNPSIMASSAHEIVAKLSADPEAVERFQNAYGHRPDRESLLDAIVSFERSLLTPDSRFDRWLAGDVNAITPDEFLGYQLFKSLGCISCHQGVNLGGNLFQRHGVFHPLGSRDPELLRVPSLRNVASTGPYFHDGSVATLPEAVKAMGVAQLDRMLTTEQIDAIVAFLNTLTGTYKGRPVTANVGVPQAAPP
jgi:cytochrome c peroxidase